MKLLFLGWILIVVLCLEVALGNEGPEICKTKSCQETAGRILDYMDPSVDPCDDFYQFACGNYLKTTDIKGKMIDSDAAEVENNVTAQMLSVLAEPPEDLEPRPYQLLRKFFNLCLNEGDMILGMKTALDLFRNSGGWPVLENDWSGRYWEFLDTYIKFLHQQLTSQSLFSVNPIVDLKNNSRRIIAFDQPEISVIKKSLLQCHGEIRENIYYKFMVFIMVKFGAERARAEKHMMGVLEFECEIMKIRRSEEQRRDYQSLYHTYTLRQLQEDIPWLEWERLMREVMPQGVSLLAEEKVMVMEPEYFRQLGVLMAKYPKETIANFMLWQEAYELLGLNLFMPDKSISKQKTCLLMVTSSSLSPALVSLYAMKYNKPIYDQSVREVVAHMAEEIREQLLKELQHVPWMEKTTRQRASKKVADIKKQIGLPHEYLCYKLIEEYYKNIRMPTNNFMEARIYLEQWRVNHTWMLLRQPVIKGFWVDNIQHDILTGAFYFSDSNTMRVTSSFLQLPWLSLELPLSVNYGGIGFVVGHELTHSLDSTGSQFDEKGNLNEWWGERTRREFNKRKQCVIDQYSRITDAKSPGINVNGTLTEWENIADIGGLKLSYLAYRNQLDQLVVPEGVLPGLQQYNNDQLFMISAANTWCTKYDPTVVPYLIKNDIHSPSPFRVKGEMMNLPEFSRAFNCSLSSPMNPENKCVIW